MSAKSETDLVQALRAGDQSACDELVRRYYDTVYRVALHLTGQPDAAEDVLQETFISACQAAQSFRNDARLSTWLYRIARNRGLQWQRSQRETVPLETDEDDEQAFNSVIADMRHIPDQALLSQELFDVVDRAILALPKTLRQAFLLREFEGLSTKEAAEALGISQSALKVRLHRARQQIQETVRRYLEEADPS